MYEGKNIHYSEVDHRPLCSYSSKICKQRRLNGYALCSRHILEDPSAPFKQCVHLSRNKQRCLNPIQKDKPTEMCNVHLSKMLAAANKEKEKAQVRAASPSYTANGAITPTTPPSTPTQDPQRLSIMERLKNKFTRVQNCPTEDVIVNVVDDSDPYAFPDNDTEPAKSGINVQPSSQPPVQTSLAQSEPAESSQKSHQSAITNVSANNTSISYNTTNVDVSVIATVVSNTSIINNVLHLSSNLSESSSVLMTPTPTTGGTPIAKMFPEIAGKLHGSPTSLERSITCNLSKTKVISCASTTRGKQSSTNSRSSRTMNKLESKIAQNRIKDKQQKAKQQKRQTVSPQTSIINSETTIMPIIPTVSSTGIGTLSSSETTSTIFSLGSIPSLGTFLPQDGGGLQLSQQKLAPLPFPVALPILGHHVTSNNVISPGMATVIPATVFTPFPNLAGALSSLHQTDAGKQTTSKQNTKDKSAAGNRTGAKNKSGRNKSGSSSSKCEKKSVRNSRKNTLKTLKNLKESDLLKEGLPLGGLTKVGINSGNMIPEEGLNIGDIIKAAVSISSQEKHTSSSLVTGSVTASSNSTQVASGNTSKQGSSGSNKKQPRMSAKLQRPRHLPLPKLNTTIISDGSLNSTYSGDKSTVKSRDQKPVIIKNSTQTNTVYSTQSAIFSVGMLSSTQQQQHQQRVNENNNFNNSKNDTRTFPTQEPMKSCIGDNKINKQLKLESDVGDGGINSSVARMGSKVTKNAQLNDGNLSEHELLCSDTNNVKIRPKRKWRGLLTENEAKRTFRRKTAVNAYKSFIEERKRSATLLTFGVDSSSDEGSEDILMSTSHWYSDDDEVRPCHTELSDPTLLSTIRATKLSLVKSKIRRQHNYTCKLSRLSSSTQSNEVKGVLSLIKAARQDARAASEVVMATGSVDGMEEIVKNSKKLWTKGRNGQKKNKCLVINPQTDVICGEVALPYTNHCVKHILYNVDQQLFDYCTAKFANNTQCCEPVFDIKHELPLCAEHALKADNYQKNLEQKQPKKPRKKTKPSALTRPPKKGKKRKNQRNRQNSETINLNIGSSASNVTEIQSCEGITGSDVEMKVEFPVISDDEKVKVKLESDDLSDLDHDFEETFSPGTIDKNLELPLDMVEATKFLDKHDLGDMLNKLPDDAFDFSSVLTKNGDLTPTKEEADMLEAAIAEASHEFSLDPQATNNIEKYSLDPQSNSSIEGLALATIDDTKDTLEDINVSLHKMQSQNESVVYLSDDNDDEKEDELTKQIASSLMHRNPLSDDDEDMDDDNINNLASSLTAHDLRSISRALSGSDLDMSLAPDQLGITQEHVLVSGQGQNILHQGRPHAQGQNIVTFQGQHQGQSDSSEFIKVKDGSDVGGQLAQILEAFGSDQSGMDTLHQNIRMFLNEDGSGQTPFIGGMVGNVNLQQQPVTQHQAGSGTESQSILHDFLTSGKVNTSTSAVLDQPHPRRESGLPIEHFIRENSGLLVRPSSNDSANSSGSGMLLGRVNQYQKQLSTASVYTVDSNDTPPPPPIVTVTEIPPNMSVNDIPSSVAMSGNKVATPPPNMSVSDIPVCLHYPGPPNVTVTAIPSSFQNVSIDWKANLAASGSMSSTIGTTTVMVGSNVIQIPVVTSNIQQQSPMSQTACSPASNSSGISESITMTQLSPRVLKKESPQRRPSTSSRSRKSSSSSIASPKIVVTSALPVVSHISGVQQGSSIRSGLGIGPQATMINNSSIMGLKGLSQLQNMLTAPSTGGPHIVQTVSQTIPHSGQQYKKDLTIVKSPKQSMPQVENSRIAALLQSGTSFSKTGVSPSAGLQPGPQLLRSGSEIIECLSPKVTPAGSPCVQSTQMTQVGNLQKTMQATNSSGKVSGNSALNTATSMSSNQLGKQEIRPSVFQAASHQIGSSPQQQQQPRFSFTPASGSSNTGQGKVNEGQQTVSDSTQAFLSALLESMAKQQLTPQQQKTVQHLEQTTIIASPSGNILPNAQHGNLIMHNNENNARKFAGISLPPSVQFQQPHQQQVSSVQNQGSSALQAILKSPRPQPPGTIENQLQNNIVLGNQVQQQRVRMLTGNQATSTATSVNSMTAPGNVNLQQSLFSQQVTNKSSAKIASFSNACVSPQCSPVVHHHNAENRVHVTPTKLCDNISTGVQQSGNNTQTINQVLMTAVVSSSMIQNTGESQALLQSGVATPSELKNTNVSTSVNVVNLLTQGVNKPVEIVQNSLHGCSSVRNSLSSVQAVGSNVSKNCSPDIHLSNVHSIMKIPAPGIPNFPQNLGIQQQNITGLNTQQNFHLASSLAVQQPRPQQITTNILQKTLLQGTAGTTAVPPTTLPQQTPLISINNVTSGLTNIQTTPSSVPVVNIKQNLVNMQMGTQTNEQHASTLITSSVQGVTPLMSTNMSDIATNLPRNIQGSIPSVSTQIQNLVQNLSGIQNVTSSFPVNTVQGNTDGILSKLTQNIQTLPSQNANRNAQGTSLPIIQTNIQNLPTQNNSMQNIPGQINLTSFRDLPALLSGNTNIRGLSSGNVRAPSIQQVPVQINNSNIQNLPAPIPSINVQGIHSSNLQRIQVPIVSVSNQPMLAPDAKMAQSTAIRIQEIRQQIPSLNFPDGLPVQMPTSSHQISNNFQQQNIGTSQIPLSNIQATSLQMPSVNLQTGNLPDVSSTQIVGLSAQIPGSSSSLQVPTQIMASNTQIMAGNNSSSLGSQVIITQSQSIPSPIPSVVQLSTATKSVSNIRGALPLQQSNIHPTNIQGIPTPIPSPIFQQQNQAGPLQPSITSQLPPNSNTSQSALTPVCTSTTTLQGSQQQNIPRIPTPAPLPTVAAFAPIPANMLPNGLPQLAAALQSQGLSGGVGVKFAYPLQALQLPAGILAGLGAGNGNQATAGAAGQVPRQPFLIATLPPASQQQLPQHQQQPQQQQTQLAQAPPPSPMDVKKSD